MNEPTLDTSGEFARLHRCMCHTLHAFFCRRGVEREQARDLVQQTFLQAFEHWDTFRGEATRGTWLLRIGLNVWRNSVRARLAIKRAAPTVSLDDVTGLQAPPEPHDSGRGDPEQAYSAREREARVREALGRLPARMRACVTLRARGLTYRQIATLLRISEGAVKSQTHEGKSRLRELLAEPAPRGRV